MDTTQTARPPYNPAKIGPMTTEAIQARLAAAQVAVAADAGKRYRGYKWEAQMQRIRSLQFWGRVAKDREAGLI